LEILKKRATAERLAAFFVSREPFGSEARQGKHGKTSGHDARGGEKFIDVE
jgi:hypothetical protein